MSVGLLLLLTMDVLHETVSDPGFESVVFRCGATRDIGKFLRPDWTHAGVLDSGTPASQEERQEKTFR